jgi:hypothetical protein
MGRIGDHHVKWSKWRKPGSEGQKSHVLPLMWKLDLKDKYAHKYMYDLIHIYIYLSFYHLSIDIYDCNNGSVWGDYGEEREEKEKDRE